jgi:hypothetical protein
MAARTKRIPRRNRGGISAMRGSATTTVEAPIKAQSTMPSRGSRSMLNVYTIAARDPTVIQNKAQAFSIERLITSFDFPAAFHSSGIYLQPT